MEKSKKLVCLLLAICALSALCAVGAVPVSAADSIDTSHIYFLNQFFDSSGNNNFNRFDTDFSYLYQRSPLFPTSGGYMLQNCLLKLPLTSSPSNVLFSCSMTWTVHNDRNAAVVSSDVASYFQSTFKPVYFVSGGSPTLLTSLYTSPSCSFSYDSSSKVFNVSVYFFADLSSIEVSSNDFNNFYIGFQVKSLAGFFTSSNQYAPVVNFKPVSLISSDFAVDTDPPEPEPEPDPDAYNPIPDVYDTVTPTLYFTNYKSTGDASFAYLNRPFSSFPSPDYAWTTQFPDVIVGAFYDNFSLISQPLDSLCGQTSVVFTDPLGNFDTYDVSLNQRGTRAFTNVEIWLVSGSEPSISGFRYFTCPSDWVKTTLWRYPISPYSTEYVCNFQINFPENYIQTVGFTPVNFFVRIYRSVADGQGVGRPYDVWYDVTNFVLGSYARPSADPEDIPPTPYDPPFTDPSNPGSEVTNTLDEEQRRIEDAYNPEEGQAAADSTFDLSALGTAFTRLVDGMGYTGTDFHFYMPSSGNVPFLNTVLWQQSEIPFKTWIDALPPAILTVIRFLAWLGLGFSFAHMIRKLISDINGGDKE